MATMYLNLGSLYEDQEIIPKSLDYYNKSLAIFQKENISLVLPMAISVWVRFIKKQVNMKRP